MRVFIRRYHKISQRPLEDTTGPFEADPSVLTDEQAFRAFVGPRGFGKLGKCREFRADGQKATFFFGPRDTDHCLVVEASGFPDIYGYLGITEQVFIVHFDGGYQSVPGRDVGATYAAMVRGDDVEIQLRSCGVDFRAVSMVAKRGYAYLTYYPSNSVAPISTADVARDVNIRRLPNVRVREVTCDPHNGRASQKPEWLLHFTRPV